MDESEHDVYWLRLEEGGRLQESRSLPVRVQPVEWRQRSHQTRWLDYLKLKTDFSAVINKIQPDIIHAGPIQRVALLPALCGARPLISMSWAFDLLQDADRDFIWKLATRYVLRKSDWFISDCQTVKSKALSMGVPEDHTTVFPWGVDLSHFHPGDKWADRNLLGYNQGLVLVHTRSWEPRYGVDIALQGFWLALQTVPDIRLVMLGGGSQEKWIEQFIHDKGIQMRVQLCGYQKNEDLALYFRAADVYLSASHIDGSSVALLESMACGCPALVSDISANLEWVQHGVQGWVFRDGDTQGLADQIIQIARNREMLPTAGRLARAKSEREADWRKNVRLLLDTYERVASARFPVS